MTYSPLPTPLTDGVLVVCFSRDTSCFCLCFESFTLSETIISRRKKNKTKAPFIKASGRAHKIRMQNFIPKSLKHDVNIWAFVWKTRVLCSCLVVTEFQYRISFGRQKRLDIGLSQSNLRIFERFDLQARLGVPKTDSFRHKCKQNLGVSETTIVNKRSVIPKHLTVSGCCLGPSSVETP